MHRRVVVSLLALLLLQGCDRYLPRLDEVLPDRRSEYRRSQSLPDLEIPPDLSADAIQDAMAIPEGAGGATYLEYQQRLQARQQSRGGPTAPLGGFPDASIEQLADEKLLVIAGEPALVWPQLEEFWRSRGARLELNDAELGVLETSWIENRADPSRPRRDRFKIFAEPGVQPGSTLLFVSHAAEAQGLDDRGQAGWRALPRDEGLEDRLVAALKEYITGASGEPLAATAGTGGSLLDAARAAPPGAAAEAPAATADRSERAELINAGDGKLYLTMAEPFDDAWRLTGSALERSGGLTVEDSDKARGLYTVRYDPSGASTPAAGGEEKKGMFSRLAFWRSNDAGSEGQYRISVTGVGGKTEVVVLDAKGNWDNSTAAADILKLLYAQLNPAL